MMDKKIFRMEFFALESYNAQAWLRLIGSSGEPRPLVWLMAGQPDETQLKELFSLLENAAAQGLIPPLALAGDALVNWADDYSPWPLDLKDGRRFGGMAANKMAQTMTQLLPEVQSRFALTGGDMPSAILWAVWLLFTTLRTADGTAAAAVPALCGIPDGWNGSPSACPTARYTSAWAAAKRTPAIRSWHAWRNVPKALHPSGF